MLISEHPRRTGSRLAEQLLARWEAVLPSFARVMPSDYKRALEEIAQKAERVSPGGESSASMPQGASHG